VGSHQKNLKFVPVPTRTLETWLLPYRMGGVRRFVAYDEFHQNLIEKAQDVWHQTSKALTFCLQVVTTVTYGHFAANLVVSFAANFACSIRLTKGFLLALLGSGISKSCVFRSLTVESVESHYRTGVCDLGGLGFWDKIKKSLNKFSTFCWLEFINLVETCSLLLQGNRWHSFPHSLRMTDGFKT
jgi:hypothetical protein